MTKQLNCREHGGTFTVEARRGRPPVRCSVENPCTNAPEVRKPNATSRRNPGARTAINRRMAEHAGKPDTKAQRDAEALKAAAHRAVRETPIGEPISSTATVLASSKAPSKPVAPRSEATPSVSKAHAAKALLEPLGWHCSARLMRTAQGPDMIEMTATRGEELLTIVWQAGSLFSQNYSLWSTMKPSDNGMPKHSLPFDPDELSDSELIRALSGMEVTWWNRIAKARESATVSPDKVNITHAYNATGDEVPGDRVVTFVDHSGSGFRSFRAGALLKIGR